MLELEVARETILASLPAATPEVVPLDSAPGRVLLDTISSPLALPSFDNSGMDGYAVRAEDLSGVTAEKPARLRLVGRIAAGQIFSGAFEAGQAVRIFTGSPIPSGADAVVMQ